MALWKSSLGKGHRPRSGFSRPRVQVLEDRPLPSVSTAANYPAGPNPTSVAVGDFNGDGIQDVAVANNGSDTVGVFLGNGDGSFQPKTDSAAGPAPASLAVGDFNGDGI